MDTWSKAMSDEQRIGNIGEKEYQKCLEYFEYYWNYFVERNPHCEFDEELMDVYFMVFLSGFSAGINQGEQNKKSLMEEIISNN